MTGTSPALICACFVASQSTALALIPTRKPINKEWNQVKPLFKIVEQLRRQHGIHSALSDFRVDDAQLSIGFKGPGYTADAFIDRDTGKYEVTETRMGLGAILNDLHKGRDTGAAWKWLIDASAVLMTLVSATGLALIFFLAKRRMSGLVSLSVGAAACFVVYLIWVR